MISDIQNYAAFISAIILFQLVPGPGTIAILHATARGGAGVGMGAVFGTLAGDLVYMTAAVTGLAALLAANPAFFSLVRWVGIVFLCRFGCQLLCAVAEHDVMGDGHAAKSGRTAFRRAFAVGLTNPKVIIFFLSFFPLFMSSGTQPVTLVIMMLHVTLISFCYQTFLVLVGDRVCRRLSGMQRVQLVARHLAGLAVLGFGIRLAFNKN